jgi:hypothetical protein
VLLTDVRGRELRGFGCEFELDWRGTIDVRIAAK